MSDGNVFTILGFQRPSQDRDFCEVFAGKAECSKAMRNDTCRSTSGVCRNLED